jgi:hypothetical protein
MSTISSSRLINTFDYYSCAKSTEGYGKYGLHSIGGYEVGELLKKGVRIGILNVC